MAIGSLIGFAVAEMLVKVLTGVFDPPPEVLSIPWSYIMVLLIAAVVSTVIAVVGAQVSVQRVGVEVLRDL
jgi:putative ABC transport system permease protein